MELKRLHNEEDEAYFQALFEMYPTAGWGKILEDMGRMKQLLDRVSDVENENELFFRKGQLDIINQLLTHQVRSEAGYALAMEEQEGQAEAPTGGRATMTGGEQ